MKKVLKILTLVMLIFTIWKIGDTYSKYFAQATTGALSQEVGKWVIYVNNLDLSAGGESVQFEVDNFSNFSNPNAAEGEEQNATPDKISPGSEGYADIVIDPTGTDVAVRYDIELDTTAISNLAMTARLEMASGENTLVKTGENTYTGIISLADVKAGNKANVRCYITWENDETRNEEDSELGKVPDQSVSVSAIVTITQHLGEIPTEYVEP